MTLTEMEIYAECKALGMTDAGAAGATANILEESGGKSNNLQNSYNDVFHITDEEYTRQIDAGTRNFIDQAGYGYCQWTAGDRKKNLYDYLKGHGKSIDDSKGQFQFMGREMRQSFSFVWKRLTTSDDPYDCGYVMCKFYEIPEYTESKSQYRGNLAEQIYRRCVGQSAPITPATPAPQQPEKETMWPPRMLCKGMNGADVTVLQALLVAHGYGMTAVNGVFGDSTEKALRNYQQDHGLAVDGIAGPLTWAALTRR